MSIKYESSSGCYLSHNDYIQDIYKNVWDNGAIISLQYKNGMFDINTPYKKQSTCSKTKKRKKLSEDESGDFEELSAEIDYVKEKYVVFKAELMSRGILNGLGEFNDNQRALEFSDNVYKESKNAAVLNAIGANASPAIVTTINGERFVFPERCKFFCKNTSDIGECLRDASFDLILLDPPWWNKYIRRKNKKSGDAYEMMYNDDLKSLPIESMLKEEGIVAVWCTNSVQHAKELKEDIFSKWGVSYVGTWYWMKVTNSGKEICYFSEPPGKQPFERIIFGAKSGSIRNFVDKKLIVSVPSALHSHKPPLVEVLKEFLHDNSQCLEIFARYLVPNWTSYGLEAILLQHESLFEKMPTT